MAYNNKSVLMLSLLGLLLQNCSTASNEFSADVSDTSDQASQLSNVTALSLNDSSTTITIEAPSADEDVALVVYGSASTATNIDISISDDETDLSLSALKASQNHRSQTQTESESEEDFHDRLRRYEADHLKGSQAVKPVGFQAVAQQSLAEGDEDTFYVMSSLEDYDEYETVTATLMYQSESFNYFVDNEALENMPEDDIVTLCENFEAVIEAMHDHFGYESDVNGDGRFDILSTPVVNRLGQSSQSITTGFFFARDLYDVEGSNQREVFYTAVADPEGDFGVPISKRFVFSNILRGVLPHEYQHMINYNEHVLVRESESEEQWLNEGLSHLAEDIYDRDENGYMVSTGIENPARVEVYLENASETCFVCGSSLAARGGSYLFLRALYEASERGEYAGLDSGMSLTQALLQSDQQGEDNILHALYGDEAENYDFNDLIGDFAMMLFSSRYENLSDDSEFQALEGIDLFASQDDNRGTVLNGVNEIELDDLSYSGEVSKNAVMVIRISGEALVRTQGTFTLSSSSNVTLNGYLFQGLD